MDRFSPGVIRLHSLDVGFDLRLDDMPVLVPPDAVAADIEGDRHEHVLLDAASAEELVRLLRSHGYPAVLRAVETGEPKQ